MQFSQGYCCCAIIIDFVAAEGYDWVFADYTLILFVFNVFLVVFFRHPTRASGLVRLVVGAAKEWLSAVFPSFNNKIAIAAAVTLQDG